jgi:hypothetical protein
LLAAPCIPLTVDEFTVIDPEADDVYINEPSVVFTFFNVLVVILTIPVVEILIGTYVPLNVIKVPDPIVVFVSVNVPTLTEIIVNPIVIADVPVWHNTDDVNVKLLVDEIRGVTPFPSVVPNLISIKFNSNAPSFVIPAPPPPKALPTVIVANPVELDFTIVFVNVTL